MKFGNCLIRAARIGPLPGTLAPPRPRVPGPPHRPNIVFTPSVISHRTNPPSILKAILPILLIVAGLVFAYLGITTFQNSTAGVEVLGIDLSATDEGGQSTAILYGVLSVVCLGLGAFTFGKAGK